MALKVPVTIRRCAFPEHRPVRSDPPPIDRVTHEVAPPPPESLAMSTSVSPETKRPRMCDGDVVLPGIDELPNVVLPPDHAELDIAAVLSSLKTNMEREFSEALSKLRECGASHIQMRSGFAGSAMKTLREMVSSFQDKCFPKMRKRTPM